MLILNDSTLVPSHQIISYPLDGLIFCWLWRILECNLYMLLVTDPEPWMVNRDVGLELARRQTTSIWNVRFGGWDSSHNLIYSQIFQVKKSSPRYS